MGERFFSAYCNTATRNTESSITVTSITVTSITVTSITVTSITVTSITDQHHGPASRNPEQRHERNANVTALCLDGDRIQFLQLRIERRANFLRLRGQLLFELRILLT